jgi:hypothetical protein
MDYYTIPWKSLSSQLKRERILAMAILRSLRNGDSIRDSLGRIELPFKAVKDHLGSNLFKEKGRWWAQPEDQLEVEMLIYERGRGATTLITTNSKDRSVIGSYFASVKKALKSADDAELDQFRNVKIVDSDGKTHSFETDLDTLYDIEEAQEEPEFVEIYQH